MAYLEAPQFRPAGRDDAEAVANLHADRWRRHYRRAYSDAFLDAEAVVERPEGTGLYLWVLEQNLEAQAFYQARGGRCVGRGVVSPPSGIASRLTGSPAKLRYAWPEPTALLGQPSATLARTVIDSPATG